MRFYDGLPSVTTILDIRRKPGLEAWQARVGDEAAETKRNDAAELGQAVHALIQASIEDGLLEIDPEDDAYPYVQGFYNWRDKYQPTHLRSEVPVVSKKYGYAGTADLLCKIEGEPYVIDFKTSKQIDPGMGLQLRAYEQAHREMSRVHSRMAILQLTPDTISKYRLKLFESDLQVFLAHKTIFDWMMAEGIVKAPVTYTGGLIG